MQFFPITANNVPSWLADFGGFANLAMAWASDPNRPLTGLVVGLSH